MWAHVVVGARLLLLILSLLLAVAGPVLGWIASVVVTILLVSLFRSLVRISLSDMVDPDWEPRSPVRFVQLVLVNLAEAITAVAAALAALESIEPGDSFGPTLESPGESWLAAASPIGGSGPAAVSGWAQALSVLGIILVLWVLVVAVAAAVNGYSRKRRVRPDGAGHKP